jgi:hypothetical protein
MTNKSSCDTHSKERETKHGNRGLDVFPLTGMKAWQEREDKAMIKNSFLATAIMALPLSKELSDESEPLYTLLPIERAR